MGTPKRQHWLPRFYLRGFRAQSSSPGGEAQVWLFRRDDGDPVLTNIENVGVKSQLYSPKAKGGERSYAIENELAQLESVVATIWPAIAEGTVPLANESARKTIALFVATLHLRNPARLAEVRHSHQRLVRFFDSLPKKADGTPAVAEITYQDQTRPMDTSGWVEYSSAGKEELQRRFVQTIGATARQMAEQLLLRRWTIVASETPAFATSDAPVVLSHPVRSRFGFSTPGTTVHLPLSPTRFLMISDPGLPGGYYPSTPDFAEAMNYQTWTAADQFLISSLPSDDVLAGIMKLADAMKRLQRDEGDSSPMRS